MRRGAANRVGIALVIALVVAVGGRGRALAHPPPLGTGLWWVPQPSSSSERLVIRTPRGFLLESQTPGDFRFLCNEALGVADGEDASFAQLRGVALLVATYAKGVIRGTPDGCSWAPVPGAMTAPAFDVVAVDPDATALVVGGTASSGDHFWAGRDGATMWSALANDEIPYTRVRVAPSAPGRVYLTGLGLDLAGRLVHRLGVSDDGGATVTQVDLSLEANDLQARILDVDPTRPDHLYLRVESNSAQLPERLLMSRDAGRSFSVGPLLHDLQGFAQSDDGMRVWAGGKEGIYRSDDGGASFDSTPGEALTSVTCLAFHRGRLYACGVLDHQLVVAESDDQGGSFRKLFSFDQVRASVDCPAMDGAPSPVTVCASSLEHWRSELGTLDPTTAGGTGGGAGSSGAPSGTGASPGPQPSRGGASGCNVAGPGEVLGVGPCVALVAFALRWRRRPARG